MPGSCRSTQHWAVQRIERIEGEVWPFEQIVAERDGKTGLLEPVDLTGVTFRLQIREEPGGTLIHTADITPVKEEVEDLDTSYGTISGEFWFLRENVDLGNMSETAAPLGVGTYAWGLWETSPRTIAWVQGDFVVLSDSGGGED